MSQLAFVVGLAMEARVLLRALGEHDPGVHLRIACAAADSDRARHAAERLLADGAGALVSFGIAGGLDPALIPGDLILAERVSHPDGRSIATDANWRRACEARANEAGLRAVGGTLIGSERAIAPVAEKRRLFEARGGIAVDMESHAVAHAAEASGVPFLVVRAVADPANRPLPSAVIGTIGSDGRTRASLAAARLCVRSWQVFEVLRLRKDTRTALAALGRLARLLGPDSFGIGLSGRA